MNTDKSKGKKRVKNDDAMKAKSSEKQVDDSRDKTLLNNAPVEKVDEADDVETSKMESVKEEITDAETIAQLADKIEILTNELLRERAAVINYRKRMEEEKSQIRRYGAYDMAFDLLTILDYFEESMKFDSADLDTKSVLQGVKFTIEEMYKLLGRHGIKEIETDIPFNPKLHEAFSTEETEDHNSGDILNVHRKGYMYKDRILRAAMVTVAREPEKSDKTEDKNRTNSGE
ncbi:nucleotide exchange factor GrpE [bacterium]|nr:nucleotide exchange factor GrpE [bacterium]